MPATDKIPGLRHVPSHPWQFFNTVSMDSVPAFNSNRHTENKLNKNKINALDYFHFLVGNYYFAPDEISTRLSAQWVMETSHDSPCQNAHKLLHAGLLQNASKCHQCAAVLIQCSCCHQVYQWFAASVDCEENVQQIHDTPQAKTALCWAKGVAFNLWKAMLRQKLQKFASKTKTSSKKGRLKTSGWKTNGLQGV